VSFYEREGFYLAEILRGYYPRLDPPDAALLRRTLP
jgi:ribosomal protein S18 acetylase RimI-like enzyme